MRVLAFLTSLVLVGAGAWAIVSWQRTGVAGTPATTATASRGACDAPRNVVAIREADPLANPAHHDLMRDAFIHAVDRPHTTVLIGPNVVLDFSKLERREEREPRDEEDRRALAIALPIRIRHCVTIRSVAWFGQADISIRPDGVVVARGFPPDTRNGSPGATSPSPGDLPTTVLGRPGDPRPIPEARSSTSPGPLLRFGQHRQSGDNTFFEARCFVGLQDQADHIRISGFRLHGPDFGQQEVGDKGILIDKCVDVEISNMEIAAFGGEGIRVQDGADEYFKPEILAEVWQLRGIDGVCREPPYNGSTGRIGRADQVRIIGNYIHSNQQPSHDGHAGGYGVQVTGGAHALIMRNVFSANRHSIEGGGDMGGYDATQNLVLRYGGIHWDWPITIRTHAFDIHGTGDNGFEGWAGARTTYSFNAFQFDADNAIKIRGSPRCGIDIRDNVFPHPGLEHDDGADAVWLQYRQDIGAIRLGPNNQLNTQTYGQYGVCDFDGDGIDDLFLATGVSWWFSGMGEFPWRFLALQGERLGRLRFGYFDADVRCDVVTERDGTWMVSSGGTGRWYPLSRAYAPLSETEFGRFDLRDMDRRAGATRRATHAFRRTASGQWQIVRLTDTNEDWRDVRRSALRMDALRFGDFDGDGVTDVLAVVDGRWAKSAGAAMPWSHINGSLGDDVRGLHIADIDHNNSDDILRLRYRAVPDGHERVMEIVEWEVSYDGTSAWQPLKSYRWLSAGSGPLPVYAFTGRFGAAPGEAILTVDRAGIGQFYAPLESRVGARPDWSSTFHY